MNTNDELVKAYLVSDEMDITKSFLKKVEHTFRTSLEYKQMLFTHRDVELENSCLFLDDIDFTEKGLSLEFHHIITLYTLAEWTTRLLLKNGCRNITTFEVCNKLAELHFEDKVPYVFLAKTMHEVQHSEQKYKYEIPVKDIQGNYKALIEEYKEVLTENDKKLVMLSLGIEVK